MNWARAWWHFSTRYSGSSSSRPSHPRTWSSISRWLSTWSTQKRARAPRTQQATPKSTPPSPASSAPWPRSSTTCSRRSWRRPWTAPSGTTPLGPTAAADSPTSSAPSSVRSLSASSVPITTGSSVLSTGTQTQLPPSRHRREPLAISPPRLITTLNIITLIITKDWRFVQFALCLACWLMFRSMCISVDAIQDLLFILNSAQLLQYCKTNLFNISKIVLLFWDVHCKPKSKWKWKFVWFY